MNPVCFRIKSTSYRSRDWCSLPIFNIAFICSLVLISSLLEVALSDASDIRFNPQKKTHQTRLAIFLVESGHKNKVDHDLAQSAIDLLTVALMDKPNIELVERAMIETILHEYGLALGPFTQPGKAIRIGKMVGADLTILARPIRELKKMRLLLKVVHNTSGIIKDMAYFEIKNKLSQAVSELTEFIWVAGTTDVGAGPKSYLSVGGFHDRSINDTQIDRGDDIRRFLEHRYTTAPNISVVARSQMKPLLVEMGLNKMGLTKGSSNTGDVQHAFTIVDGEYHIIRKAETIYIVNVKIAVLGRHDRYIKVQGTSWRSVLEQIGQKIDLSLEAMK